MDVGYQNLMASPFFNEFFKPFGAFAVDKAGNANYRLVALGALSKYGVASIPERWGVCGMSPRKDVVAVEDNVPEAVGTFSIKNQH